MSCVVFSFSRAPGLIPYPSFGPHALLRRGLTCVSVLVRPRFGWFRGLHGVLVVVVGPWRNGLGWEWLMGKCTVSCAKGCQTLLSERERRAEKVKGAKKKPRLPGVKEAGFRGFVWGYRRPDGPRGRAETQGFRAPGSGGRFVASS